MTAQFLGWRRSVDCGLQTAEQVANHRVILFEPTQHWAQLRMFSFDGREQGMVLALMVAVEGRAEAVAVQQEFAGGRLAGCAIREGVAGRGERCP